MEVPARITYPSEVCRPIPRRSLMNRWMTAVLVSALAGAPAWAGWQAADRAAYDAAKAAGDAAETAGEFDKAAGEFAKAAELAGKAGMTTAQAWRLNNAGFVMIKAFKAKVDYDNLVPKLEGMTPSPEKYAALKEADALFKANAALLDQASQSLEQAKALGVEGPASVIEKNLGFVSWAKSFTAEGETAAAAPAPAAPAQ
jgi:hypothetical protein